MCVAFPMKIVKVEGDFAEARAGDVRARVNIRLIEKVRQGDCVLVHAGMAIEKVSLQRANEIWDVLKELSHKAEHHS